MRGVRAKQLRRAANASTPGIPAVSYMLDPRSIKMYRMKDGTDEKMTFTYTLAPSVRHFYHLLKKQYQLWQESGEIKARHQRAVDRDLTNRFLLEEEFKRGT
jgi:hypothetical protein